MARFLLSFGLAFLSTAMLAGRSTSADDLQVLFMGDNGHHRPVDRFHELAPALAERGVSLTYTDDMDALNPETLAEFDGLMLYANIDRIEDDQANAVLDFVAGGKGFIPLHCASWCWRNNSDIVALMGGQFLRHGGQVFTTQIVEPQHPVMQGHQTFSSWDETYIHQRHNEQNRTVLEYRSEGEQAEGRDREPWTWVRTHGEGRVFYTAWGHDQRTFTNPGFHDLVARGTLWACGADPTVLPPVSGPREFIPPQMTELPDDLPPFQYEDVGPKIPNYTPGGQWGTQGEAHTLMQRPLPPEESRKHFVTPQGLTVRLYADESQFQAKPIAMTWDERGRLWVCETVDYPNELGGGRDRIRICEDTDGDHVADRFTLFAEDLSIPTAIVIVRGGAVVQNGQETIYLKDTDGDDRADQRTTLISGWALGDTHGGVSNFRYGLDNWIWAMQGYNNSRPAYNGRRAQSFRMGFWRFRLSDSDPPVVTDLEFVRSTNNNTWGLGISEEGLIFGSTANRNPSVFMPIANRFYERVRGWAPPDIGTIADTHLFRPVTDKVRQVDQFGGYTAGAGHALYTARTFPQQWWNQTAFVCGPTGHLVGTFVLQPQGSGYRSTSPVNLLASDDEWSAPIMAEVGPDGAIWVIDWYNFIVQHNPTPQGFETGKGNAYVSDLRDKKHGRVYRVTPTSDAGDHLHEARNLAELDDAELVEQLQHPAMVWRLQAQRLLIERGATDIVPALRGLLSDRSVDAIGLNVGAIHALRTLDGLGQIGNDEAVDAAVVAALAHPSEGVRRNAAAVLPRNAFGLQALLGQQDTIFSASSPQVRLQALLTLSEMPTGNDAVGGLIAAQLQRSPDRWIHDALTAAAAAHSRSFIPAVMRSGTATSDAGPPSPAALETIGVVAEHIARGRPTLDEMHTLLSGLSDADPQRIAALVRGLTERWPRDHQLPDNARLDDDLLALLDAVPGRGKGQLLQLAERCGSRALAAHAAEILSSMMAVVQDDSAAPAARIAAAAEAVAFQPDHPELVHDVLETVSAQAAPELVSGMLEAVAQSTSDALGAALLQKAAELTPQGKASAIRILIARPATARTLLRGIQDRVVDAGDLTLDQKQALQSHPDRELRQLARTVFAATGGLPDPNREKVLQSLLELCDQTGDIDVGRKMFDKHCSRCHRHGSEGKDIGPNLTGMAVHPKEELLTHIIDPSRSVEGNFRIYTVVNIDGLVINGMMTSESRTSMTLVDTEAKEHVIAREDIDELIASRKSLMPEGFEKQMTEAELSGLLEFLTAKGRYLPISLDRYATAVSTKGLFGDGDNGPDRLVFDDWTPKVSDGIPFVLTDPRGKSVPNIILLHGPRGSMPPQMPRQVTLPCNSPASAIHLLSGVGGWSWPFEREPTVSMIVRLNYRDGTSEDHELRNGVHFADYIRRVDVPESELAFMLGGQQIRRIAVTPGRPDQPIDTIELIKGSDSTAPIVMAVTVERPTAGT